MFEAGFKKGDRVQVLDTADTKYRGCQGVVRGAHPPNLTHYSVRVNFVVKDLPFADEFTILEVVGEDFHPSDLKKIGVRQ